MRIDLDAGFGAGSPAIDAALVPLYGCAGVAPGDDAGDEVAVRAVPLPRAS